MLWTLAFRAEHGISKVGAPEEPDELEALAGEIAKSQASDPYSRGSRKLADVLRCLRLVKKGDFG